MNYKIAHNIREVIYIAAIWVTVAMSYIYIKFNDIPDDLLSEIYHHQPSISKKWLYEITFLISLTIGITLGLLHTFLYSRLARARSLLFNIAFRALVLFALSIFAFFIISYIYKGQTESTLSNLFDIARRDFVISTFASILVTENLVSIFIVLRRSLGPNFLLNTITNTYRNPKEEDRIFMFIDMVDSTPTAKKLGHLKFSKYIQDCFFDLSDITLKHGGEIYQFVGDEAVITWKVSRDFNHRKCIDLFFSYQHYLDDNQEHYINRYGYQPTFRASLHRGKVSAALVGDYKKEIAYHGDVLNLCARLQAACRESNADLLVSEDFCRNFYDEEKYVREPILLTGLKGISLEQNVMRVIERVTQ
jgi:adenylate cyclase